MGVLGLFAVVYLIFYIVLTENSRYDIVTLSEAGDDELPRQRYRRIRELPQWIESEQHDQQFR